MKIFTDALITCYKAVSFEQKTNDASWACLSAAGEDDSLGFDEKFNNLKRLMEDSDEFAKGMLENKVLMLLAPVLHFCFR